MFNRRTFLKTGAAALPLATALDALDPASALSADDIAALNGPAPKLSPLPPRLTSLFCRHHAFLMHVNLL